MAGVAHVALSCRWQNAGSYTDLYDLWVAPLFRLFGQDGNTASRAGTRQTLFPHELVASIDCCRNAGLLLSVWPPDLARLRRLVEESRRLRGVNAAAGQAAMSGLNTVDIEQAQDAICRPAVSISHLTSDTRIPATGNPADRVRAPTSQERGPRKPPVDEDSTERPRPLPAPASTFSVSPANGTMVCLPVVQAPPTALLSPTLAAAASSTVVQLGVVDQAANLNTESTGYMLRASQSSWVYIDYDNMPQDDTQRLTFSSSESVQARPHATFTEEINPIAVSATLVPSIRDVLAASFPSGGPPYTPYKNLLVSYTLQR